MNVAIIDDGVNEYVFNGISLINDVEVSEELIVRKREEHVRGRNSHGTTCAAIINKYAPDAQITSIKILNNKTKKGNSAKLVESIDWCVNNGIKLVNMSLGTIYYRDYEKVKKCINNASKKGLIIVAACNNGNVITYPASFANVIGVRSDKSGLLRGKLYSYNTAIFSGIEITACGKHTLATEEGQTIETEGSNSFAAPVITALIHNMIMKNHEITLEHIKYELWTKSLNYNPEVGYNPGVYFRGDWIEKALVFRLYEDQQELEMFEYQFDIYKIIDIKVRKLTGITEVIDDYIQEFDGCRECIDTIVIESYTSNILCDSNAFDEMNSKAEDYGMNLMYISDRYGSSTENFKYRKHMYKNKVWHNKVWDFYDKDPYIRSKIKVPVVITYDLTGKEGIGFIKHLRDYFRKDDYFCVAGADKCVAVVSDIEYIPLEYYSNSFGIGLLYNYYRPDIILYGINTLKDRKSSLEINLSVDADINVLIVDEYDENVISFVNKIRNSDSSTIILYKQSNNIQLEDKVHLFEYKGINVELYKFIIQLFENDQN